MREAMTTVMAVEISRQKPRALVTFTLLTPRTRMILYP